MLGGNAAKVYDFDMDQLRKVAVEIEAPTVAEVRVPLDQRPRRRDVAGVRGRRQPHLVGSVGEGPLTTEGMPMVADAMALPALHDPRLQTCPRPVPAEHGSVAPRASRRR